MIRLEISLKAGAGVGRSLGERLVWSYMIAFVHL